MKESQMIKALKAKNEEAFDYCYQKYKNLLYFHIYGILKNHETSEEVLLDTFIKIYDNIDTFDGMYFKAWIVKIAKNTAISELRKVKENMVFDENLYVKEVISDYDLQDYLTDLSLILDNEEYLIMIYHLIYDLSLTEISHILEKPRGTIGWKYNQALKKARIYFNEHQINLKGGEDNEY